MKKDMVHIYLESELKKQLYDEAKKRGMSLNSYLNLIIYNRQK